MSSLIKIIKKLQEETGREYGLREIARERIFSWATDLKTVRNIVQRDALGANLLKAKIVGGGRGSRYFVKAQNIVKFLEIYGAGLSLKINHTKNGRKKDINVKTKRGKSSLEKLSR